MKKTSLTFAIMFFSLSIFSLPKNYVFIDLLTGEQKNFDNKSKKDKELVMFWGTWCAECKEKLTHLLPQINNRNDVQVITINIDQDSLRAKNYVNKLKLTIPVLQNSDGHLVKDLKVFAVPHWAVYSKNKKQDDWELIDNAEAFDLKRVEKALQ